MPQIDRPYSIVKGESKKLEHPLDRPKRAKLTIMLESKNPNVTDQVLSFDYSTVRRLYNMPFIDHDKHMTKEEFGNKVVSEAKDIIVG